jgi:hypothetical protein
MHQSRAQTVAAGLGFFSIGLGLAELVAPRLVRQAMAFRCSDGMVRLYGARELINGVGILLAWKRAPWVWARGAGDALDIAPARSPAGVAARAGGAAVVTAPPAQQSPEEYAPPRRHYDYRSRSGFPRSAAAMRGRALAKKERAQGPLSFEATTRV